MFKTLFASILMTLTLMQHASADILEDAKATLTNKYYEIIVENDGGATQISPLADTGAVTGSETLAYGARWAGRKIEDKNAIHIKFAGGVDRLDRMAEAKINDALRKHPEAKVTIIYGHHETEKKVLVARLKGEKRAATAVAIISAIGSAASQVSAINSANDGKFGTAILHAVNSRSAANTSMEAAASADRLAGNIDHIENGGHFQRFNVDTDVSDADPTKVRTAIAKLEKLDGEQIKGAKVVPKMKRVMALSGVNWALHLVSAVAITDAVLELYEGHELVTGEQPYYYRGARGRVR